MTSPKVSIIIPTYNSAKTLRYTLESIDSQTYSNIEVLLIDNYSSDETPQLAKEYNARLILLRGERTRAKNYGARIASGEYVLFIDSDMVLEPKVVEECVYVAESDSRIAGVIIPEKTIGDSVWSKIRAYERRFYENTIIESPRFFRRDLVLKVSGFDEDIIFYEESTLPYKLEKLGYNVRARISSYILHYEYDFSLIKWLKKKYYYGKTIRAYKDKYQSYYKRQAGVMSRLKIFLLNKDFYSKPHLALGVLLLKSLEYVAMTLGYIRSYLTINTRVE